MGKIIESELFAGCFCGAVIISLNSSPRRVINCHCNQCRSLNGSVFTTWVSFSACSIEIDNPNNLANFRVSENGIRYFCKSCGTHLFSADSRYESVIGIPIGAIKGSLPMPSGHYFVSNKVSWYTISDDLPQFGGDSGFVPIKNCEKS